MNKSVILYFIISSLIVTSADAQLGSSSKKNSREGWAIGIEGSYGISSLHTKILSSQEFEFDEYTLSNPRNGRTICVSGYYFFNEFFGIKSGIIYNTYESNFTLGGLFEDSKLSTDVNEDHYYLVKFADYDSDISLSYISLPVVANFTLGKPGKNGLFFEGGAVLEQKFEASHKIEGLYETYGIYPDHPEVTRIIGIEELGFVPQENIDGTGDIRTSFINISGYMSFGLNLAFGYVSTVRVGAELLYGFRDIDMGYEYEKIFGDATYKPSILKKYSIKLSYILKL